MSDGLRSKIKVAYILPHSYEYYYPKEMNDFNSLNDLDDMILRKRTNYCENKICRATQLAGIEPQLYYFSPCAKKPVEFIHDYGYDMKKIPAFNFRGGKYGMYGWQYSYSLFRELSNDDHDIYFVLTYTLNDLLPLDAYDTIALYCKKKKYPLIARHGGSSANCSIRGHSIFYRQLIKKFTLNIADKIIVPSQMEYSILKEKLKINENKLVCLKDPIDLNTYYEIPREIAASKLEKDSTKKYILFVGRLAEGKGIHHVIQILPRLIEVHPDIVFLIVGYGPFENMLRKLVAEKKLEKYVVFEGLITSNFLKYYYNVADVFVLPSYSEGTPNVIQEAVACNVPCIATNVGGIADILSEDIGILVNPKDNDSLLKGAQKILDGNFEINQKKRNKLLNEWSMDYFGRKLKKIYETVLEGYR